MASIPTGAQILSLEEALTYFPQWTTADRATARHWVAETGVTDFYVPPSGGYVAGHGGPNRSAYSDIPVNGLVMHVGFLHAWPNDADIDGDERIPLSNHRPATSTTTARPTTPTEDNSPACPSCHIASPRLADECEICGHDFAAAKAACIERFHAARGKARESLQQQDEHRRLMEDT